MTERRSTFISLRTPQTGWHCYVEIILLLSVRLRRIEGGGTWTIAAAACALITAPLFSC